MKRVCIVGWLLSMLCLLVVGCHKSPIDKQAADNIVIKYVKKHILPSKHEYLVWYFNNLEADSVVLSFSADNNAAITTENAFIYYVENCNEPWTSKIWVIIVHKNNWKYDVYERFSSIYVSFPKPMLSENWWSPLGIAYGKDQFELYE